MTDVVEVRPGQYHDSVSLLAVSRAVQQVPGVTAAMVAMATELNLDLLRGLGFVVPAAAPADLVVAFRADDEAAARAARAACDEAIAALSRGSSSASGGADVVPPRTTGSAVARAGATLAVVSVPGPYAFVEAVDALEAGASVMVFSDNVPVEQEVALKELAARRGLLAMGPDCGTAVLGGVGLGFANVVRPGPVGVVAASGTGAQQLLSLLDASGTGVSACLGVGGRDLSSAVGGRSTRQALAALDADPATELVVVVSKPPAPEVAQELDEYATGLATPVLLLLLGEGADDLTSGAERVLTTLGLPTPVWPCRLPAAGAHTAPAAEGRALRGLFSGGTLCDEAMLIASARLGPIASNIPLRPGWRLPPDLLAESHLMIDFGDDALTRGRAHPMIDPTLRLERLAREVADPRTGVVLLDVVLGHGAHLDPAAGLAPAIAGSRVPVVVSLCGTEGDPQGWPRQADVLAAAGAEVYLSNAAAARRAVELVAPGGTRPGRDGTRPESSSGAPPRRPRVDTPRWLTAEPRVATAGIDVLADALDAQAVPVERVQWRPPMAATERDLATVMGDERWARANQQAVGRMLASRALLVDVLPAYEVLGLRRGTFLHAGPPIGWERASGPLRGALIGAMVLEGLADSPEEAEQRLAAGSAVLEPCHAHAAVGPMAGVVSPSMWMFVLEDPVHGHRACCSLNEGLGKVLRYGAYGPEVLDRLRWMSAVLGPLLQRAVRRHADTAGPVDVTALVAQMLQMGDEGHNRNRAGSLLLLRELLPDLLESGAAAADVAAAARFVGGNEHFFLNVGMPACKLAADAARDVPGSSLVVAMARNGTDFGIQVSGTGDQWFTAPALVPQGLFLGGYGPQDANPDIGDSAITETAGIGGFAMAAAPAIVRFVGGEVEEAVTATRTMYEITLAESAAYQIPALGFRGTPTGIDVTKVVRTGVLPHINTGMAGRVAGTGQVGAGLVTPPAEVFSAALAALAATVPG